MDKKKRMQVVVAVIGAVLGISYLVISLILDSLWFFTLGAYYSILAAMECVILADKVRECAARKIVGHMLLLVSVPLTAVAILSIVSERGHRFNIVLMLAIAVMAFVKITLATVKLLGTRRFSSEKIFSLRCVLFVDGLVSIFALQRSMLVTFGEMAEMDMLAMNLFTGLLVSATSCFLGVSLLKKQKR